MTRSFRTTMISASTLTTGEVQFYDWFEPGLKDGTYRIDVTQILTGVPNATIDPVSQSFVVQGPRFAIEPSEVHTSFPPNGATGAFEDVLPHVVLNKRLLPWERDVPGLGGDVPWMALLVFSDGELVGDLAGGDYAQTITVRQLMAPDPNVRKPDLSAAPPIGADLQSSCKAITCSSALFAQIVPTARELPLLAHVRQVNTSGKVLLDIKDDGWFSVVVANRFPLAGTADAAARSIVHLVSLEGFGDLLTGMAPAAPAQSQVQLVSLASWTFSCLAEPSQTFEGLAQNLAYDPSSNFALRPAASLVLQLPYTPSGKSDAGTLAVQQRLNDGYVALGYHAPSGEDGFAWYRGPCSPVVPNMVPGAARFATADAATIYDPASGVFDLALATAWQAGRSLALSSKSFATALTRTRIAANATLEKYAAADRATMHAQLASLFSSTAIRTVDRPAPHTGVGHVTPPARRTRPARPAPVTAVREVLARADVQAELTQQVQDLPDAQAVAERLGDWLLLRGVPFVHLVPDARMLTMESIRFFYLDANWLGALVDGALSVGQGTSRSSAVQAALTQQLEQMAQAAALAWRAKALGQTPPAQAATPQSGFLLRSALASGWPGLGVRGTAAGAPVPLLRLEHVGPNVLIALFNGVPDTVTLSEPHEGLGFGVSDSGELTTRTLLNARVTSGPSVMVYEPAQPAAPSVAIRSGGQRVLNVSSDPNPPNHAPTAPLDLLELLASKLTIAPAAIGPAYFGVQMVKGPEEIVFSLAPQPRPHP
jgi:hypothetical protein